MEKAKQYLQTADKLLEQMTAVGGNVFLLADARRCLAEAYKIIDVPDEMEAEHEYETGGKAVEH